jgi:uncharacterized protein (DUF302 family)
MELAYTFSTPLSFDDIVAAIQASALKRSFRALHVHEVDRILADKGFAIPRYSIIEVCNASFAHQVINRYKPVGMMLPCRIVVHDEGERRAIVFMKPTLIAGMMPDQDFGSVPADAESILLEALREALGISEEHPS